MDLEKDFIGPKTTKACWLGSEQSHFTTLLQVGEFSYYVVPTTNSVFLDRLYYARHDGTLCDVFFEVGAEKRKFSAHRLILGFSSTVFRACFYGSIKSRDGDSEFNPIVIPDVDADAFHLMLDFFYSDQTIDSIAVTDINVVHLLYAAEKYDVMILKNACLRCLKNVDYSSATKILPQALYYGDEIIVELCCNLIFCHANDFLFSPEFFEWDDKIIEMIIGNDKFKPKSEFLLLERLLERASSNFVEERGIDALNNKRKALGSILYAVRFPLINMRELQAVARLDILTKVEIADLFLFLSDNSFPLKRFIAQQRVTFNLEDLKDFQKNKLQIPVYCSMIRRFKEVEESVYERDNFLVCFAADHSIKLVGIGIFDTLSSQTELILHNFEIKIRSLANLATDTRKVKINCLRRTGSGVLQIFSEDFPLLTSNLYYRLNVHIKGLTGKKTFCGIPSKDSFTNVCYKGDENIKFTFLHKDDAAYYMTEIYFTL